MKSGKKGFTLIEMLVVIAIVAILVAIIIPTVTASKAKANAAADAANLRSVLGEGNVVLFTSDRDPGESAEFVEQENVRCKSFPDAKLYLVYTIPGFIDVYFVDGATYDADAHSITGGTYYGLDYFSEVAEDGSSSYSTAKPTFPADYEEKWHLLTTTD